MDNNVQSQSGQAFSGSGEHFNYSTILDRHRKEWESSGIGADLIEANLVSYSPSESDYANFQYYDDDSEGIDLSDFKEVERRNDGRLSNNDLKVLSRIEPGGWTYITLDPVTGEPRRYLQFKPDTPRTGKDGKIIKYESFRSPEGIFFAIPDARATAIADKFGKLAEWETAKVNGSHFWEWAKNSPDIPLELDEGGKKSGSSLTHNLVSVGVMSATTAFVKGSNQLLPDIELFCNGGRSIIISFDQDDKPKTILTVVTQVKKIGAAVEALGCTAYVRVWDAKEAKGKDDLIAKYGDSWESKTQVLPLKDGLNYYYKRLPNEDKNPYELTLSGIKSTLGGLSLGESILKLDELSYPKDIKYQAAAAVALSFDNPIDDLLGWIESDFSRVPVTKTQGIIELIGAVNSEVGDNVTLLSLADSIKENSTLTRVNDIRRLLRYAHKTISPKVPEKKQKRDFIGRVVRNIRFNELSGKVEKDGKEYKDIDSVYMTDAVIESDLDIGKEFAIDAVVYFAKENRYHPVKDYLELIKNSPQLSDNEWDNLAAILLGSNDALSQIVFKKFLISAVARIYKPGCYVRMVPVLQGSQNAGKTVILKLLAGEDFYSGSLGRLDNPKDDYQLLHSYWIHEWEEIDKLNKKSAADVKAFITKTKDDYRAPYAKAPESHPRQCVIVGTCNRTDFLQDPTGNTRYSVIAVSCVDFEKAKELRDRIWATARARFFAGESWELTKIEQEVSERNNDLFTDHDPWLDPIAKYIEFLPHTTPEEVLVNGLDVPTERHTKSETKRVRDCLTILGWQRDKNQTRDGGVRARRWRPVLSIDSDPVSVVSLQNPTETGSETVSETGKTLTGNDFQDFVSVDSLKNGKKKEGEILSYSTSPKGERDQGRQNNGKSVRQLRQELETPTVQGVGAVSVSETTSETTETMRQPVPIRVGSKVRSRYDDPSVVWVVKMIQSDGYVRITNPSGDATVDKDSLYPA